MRNRSSRPTVVGGWMAALLLVSATMAAAEPGRLVTATAIDAPSGAMAWRIRYETTDADGKPAQSTGVLVAPIAPAPSARPIVAWAHGTTGVAEPCAPSLGPRALASIPSLADMTARGWAVVATDYPGLGTPGPHAYLVGAAAARAVLDAVRAARQVSKANAGSRFVVWGLSQGAHAALFTGQEASQYAPELQLSGVVAAAPPTDLTKNLGSGVDRTIRTILTAFAAESWSRVYGVDLSTIAAPRIQRVLHRLATTCGGADPAVRTKIQVLRLRRELETVDLTAIEPWQTLLRRNSAGQAAAGAPLFIAQGTKDVVVSPDVTASFVRAACERGERVRFVEIAGGVHGATATASAAEALAWIADRFAGQPAPTNCPVR